MNAITKSKLYTGLSLFLSTLLLLVLSLRLGVGENTAVFEGYAQKPLILLLNALPILLLLLLGYFISGRPWAAFLPTFLIVIGLALVDYYKLLLRNDPLLFEDLTLVSEAGNITARYNLTLSLPVILSVLLPLVWLILLIKLSARFYKPKSPARWLSAPIMVIALCLVCLVWYPSDALYQQTAGKGAAAWAPTSDYISRGMLYPFIRSASQMSGKSPEGYDAQKAKAVLGAYQDEAIPKDKKISIISIMLEAYNDFSTFESVKLDRDVYAPLHELQSRSYHGKLITNIFAGGTVDTERCFLTGQFQSAQPRGKAPSLVWYLRDQGYYCEGFHPWYSWFYNRINVDEYLGFQRYSFLEQAFSDENGNPLTSDEIFFDTVYQGFESHASAANPYFSFSISYQNHGPYSAIPEYENAALVYKDSYDMIEYGIINNYLNGIEDTTHRLCAFADRLAKSDVPAVLIAFGDHNPWLGDGNSVYQMLGINLDQTTLDGFYNYYATPFLIYLNPAAQKALGCTLVGDAGNTSAAFLLPTLFEKIGLSGSAQMQYLNNLRTQTAFINKLCYESSGAPALIDAPDAPNFIRTSQQVQYYLQQETGR